MESHHDDDETKGSVYFFVQDYIEAREASGSVRTAGPKDLTVTALGPSKQIPSAATVSLRAHLVEAGAVLLVSPGSGA
jgi:hypothetical protein